MRQFLRFLCIPEQRVDPAVIPGWVDPDSWVGVVDGCGVLGGVMKSS